MLRKGGLFCRKLLHPSLVVSLWKLGIPLRNPDQPASLGSENRSARAYEWKLFPIQREMLERLSQSLEFAPKPLQVAIQEIRVDLGQ